MSQSASLGRRPPQGVARRVAPWLVLTLVAALVATLLTHHVSLSPLGVHPREVQYSSAEAQLFIDSTPSELVDSWQDKPELGRFEAGNPDEAQTLSLWVQGEGQLEKMAIAAGIPGHGIESSGPFTEYLPDVAPPLPNTARNYRLLVDVDGVRPVLTLYAQAPTERAAVAIVDSARSQIVTYVAAQARAAKLPRGASAFVARPLGATTSGVVDPGGAWQLMLAAFGIVFLSGAVLIVARRTAADRRLLVELRARVAARRPDPDEEPDDGADLWPHTRRFLPWSIAVFIGFVFLVPIDALLASSSGTAAPLAPTPDRILLFVMTIGWLGSMGRRRRSFSRTRLRFTRIHAVLLLFVAILFLSVAVSGNDLALYGQVLPVIKKLFVVVTWTLFFVIAASVIRPGEVRPLLKLIVGLGVVLALGTLFERQFKVNLFYDLWSSLHVPMNKPAGIDTYDDIGRLSVVGPTAEPLELATLLSLVLCPAIIFAMESRTRRDRFMWLLATMIVMAGALATSRKTSVVAPVVGLAVLTVYRPRPMLRGLVLAIVPAILVIHVLAPGQLGSVISELEPSHATAVNTDKVRVQRYDAVRPDIVSHIFLGDGYSSYDPQMFRYLDNEYLGLLITAGALGMVGLLAVFAAMFTLSHPLIRGPDRTMRGPALAVQAMLAMIMVCCALFDTLAFDHVTYMLFLLGALLVAMRRPVVAPASEPAVTALPATAGREPALPRRAAHPRPAVAPGAAAGTERRRRAPVVA